MDGICCDEAVILQECFCARRGYSVGTYFMASIFSVITVQMTDCTIVNQTMDLLARVVGQPVWREYNEPVWRSWPLSAQ